MMKRPFPSSPAYEQSIRGLLRLHELTVAGQELSPEADVLRDSLEVPWYALSELEKKQITGLSGDLYSLSDPPAEPTPPNPQATTKLGEAIGAYQAGEWDRALELLRRRGRHMSPADLSAQRGRIWEGMGDFATASLFLEHAARLDAKFSVEFSLFLSRLEKGEHSIAIDRSEAILRDDGAFRPIVVLQAASILFQSTRDIDPADRTSVYRRLVEILERTRVRLSEAGPANEPLWNSTYVTLMVVLGFAYLGLGDGREARRYFDLGLSVDPENAQLLMARGLARYGAVEGAADDFTRAIQLGYPAAGPFFFLAHHHLVAHDFEACRTMCDRGLAHPASDEVRARLHEWRAIAGSELGLPEELVRADFEEAARLAPWDDEIRRNFERFDQASGRSGARPHDWIMQRASAIQARYRSEPMTLIRDAA